ncbi:flavoprotein [Phakopsora pachyrhizi]|uniref:Flavo protein n=1 Tax=Phakopsora pachyrhizi TaxID=170000 RepID=A0AAV0BQQ2_PHAPC|nr:flavoprotein [Phakopsora pachyrhizi]CAH7688371.1 flavo protein [Phakopsora pachyrhizi]CAH7690765.1 flavo protein [Phakopsora pachyrhizi]
MKSVVKNQRAGDNDLLSSKRSRTNTNNILICCSGSVAGIKIPLIVNQLRSYDKLEVQIVATENGIKFLDLDLLRDVKVWKDEDEWKDWNKVSDPILHIELRRWADMILICPCSANTLAKISNGICDNLLTSLIRASNPNEIPIYIFPSMNTMMYENPITKLQLENLKQNLNFKTLGPITKKLACGDTGIGAMTEWKDVVQIVVERFQLKLRSTHNLC